MTAVARLNRSETSGTQAIRRAVDVLRAVAQLQRSGASLSRVARATNLNASTAFRILRSLAEERLLRFEESEKRYHVGPLAYELGLAAPQESHVESRFRPAVEAVARQTCLTTYLMARSNHEAVCLSCTQGSTALRAMPVDVGQRVPLGLGAGSLAILSSLDDDEIDDILADQAKRLSIASRGKGHAKAIKERVALTRRRGFSLTSGTLVQGVSGIGVAIPDPQGFAWLAISISAVGSEFPLDEARKLAALMAEQIRMHTA